MTSNPNWKSYEDKIYAIKLEKGETSWCGEETGYWVRLQRTCTGKFYMPGSNSYPVSEYLSNSEIGWTDLETAKKNLDKVAKDLGLELIHERENK